MEKGQYLAQNMAIRGRCAMHNETHLSAHRASDQKPTIRIVAGFFQQAVKIRNDDLALALGLD